MSSNSISNSKPLTHWGRVVNAIVHGPTRSCYKSCMPHLSDKCKKVIEKEYYEATVAQVKKSPDKKCFDVFEKCMDKCLDAPNLRMGNI